MCSFDVCASVCLCVCVQWTGGRRLALYFSFENRGSMAREFSRKCETLRCENSTINTFLQSKPANH